MFFMPWARSGFVPAHKPTARFALPWLPKQNRSLSVTARIRVFSVPCSLYPMVASSRAQPRDLLLLRLGGRSITVAALIRLVTRHWSLNGNRHRVAGHASGADSQGNGEAGRDARRDLAIDLPQPHPSRGHPAEEHFGRHAPGQVSRLGFSERTHGEKRHSPWSLRTLKNNPLCQAAVPALPKASGVPKA